VKIGQFHTLELELKRPFVLRKVRTIFLPVYSGITILVSVDDKYPLAQFIINLIFLYDSENLANTVSTCVGKLGLVSTRYHPTSMWYVIYL
jgi:hypothetical protein